MEQSGVRPHVRVPFTTVTGLELPPLGGEPPRAQPGLSSWCWAQIWPCGPGPCDWPRNSIQTQREGLTIFLLPKDHCPDTFCFPRSVSSVAVLCNLGRNGGNVCTGYQLIEWIQSRVFTALGRRRWLFICWRWSLNAFTKGFWSWTLKMTEIKLAISPNPIPLQLCSEDPLWVCPAPTGSLELTLISESWHWSEGGRCRSAHVSHPQGWPLGGMLSF